MKNDHSLRARLTKVGQASLADHLEALEPGPQERLLDQVEAVDLDLLARMRAGEGLAARAHGEMEPVDYVRLEDRGPDTPAAAAGRKALRGGKVAFALLAGGQASRLRWDGPKGTYPVGPATQRSLFQILVERIIRTGRDYRHVPPLAVTTSVTTDAATRSFFELNDCFRMSRKRLRFACQASLPALDEQGRLILAAPDKVFRSPDGHGGAVLALEQEGILEEWEERGIEVVCTFQVDNPLLVVVDPEFLGRLLTSDASIATKVLMKREPLERLGVVARVGGRPAIVEYSEIPREQAEARDADGRLTYRLGSIAVHAFRIPFLRRELRDPLPLHTARKEVPVVDADGAESRVWGTKFERFIFDLFPRADAVVPVEVSREREYHPIKNAEGNESPETARAALEAEYRRWYREAGREPPAEGPLEISPLHAIGPADIGAA
jgi:UDP-N-acetylglucosamine/UDP-N-acetylgalactosamine diphosphorylase